MVVVVGFLYYSTTDAFSGNTECFARRDCVKRNERRRGTLLGGS